jgi:aspartyl/asparaginyl-tRNA synthetase
MWNERLRRRRSALHPERTFDLLVPEVPEVISGAKTDRHRKMEGRA